MPYSALSYAGLILWSGVLFFYVYWKIAKRYLLKKPIKLPPEVGLEKKEEYLAQQKLIYNKASRGLKRILYFSGFALAADSVVISLLASFGVGSRQAFVLPSIILASSLIPGFFLLMILAAFTNDYLKRLENNDVVVEASPEEEGEKIWLVNLLPLLGLALFYQGRVHLLNQLGFGTGLALTVVVLSMVFFIRKESVGLGINVILLGFVFISYLAPQFQYLNEFSTHRGFGWLIGNYAVQILPLLAIAVGVAQLAKRPLVDGMGATSPEMAKLALRYLKAPFFMAVLTPTVAMFLQVKKVMPYSLTVVGLQALAWGGVLISLNLEARQGKLDFAAVQNYIRKDRKYRLPFDVTFVRLIALALLLLSAAFETYRELWLFFGISILWAVLMFLSLWKIWRYALPE